MSSNNFELMAPAGNMECFMAAIQAGADSIYFGVEQLNMRARQTMNFTIEDLPEVGRLAREHNIRTYITLNTIMYDHDISLVKRICNAAKENGISAVIASDLAVLMHAQTIKLPVHISTQLNITNADSVKFFAPYAETMVLSRELSLRQVRAIYDAIQREQIKGPEGKLVELEIFGHGALCMAVSGKCYLSLHTENASANRGACVQNCRRTYKVIDVEAGHELEIDNEYIMSPKDLCTIDILDQVIDAGVRVLKIEGRAKGPEYVFTVTKCYREAIDSYYEGTYTKEKVSNWMKELETVFNRGFWNGYYMGQQLGEWTDTGGSKATTRKVYIGKGLHYYSKIGVGEFLIEAQSLSVGDRILVTGPTTGLIEAQIEEMHVDDSGKQEKAVKGQKICLKLDKQIRPSDRLYKVVNAEELVS